MARSLTTSAADDLQRRVDNCLTDIPSVQEECRGGRGTFKVIRSSSKKGYEEVLNSSRIQSSSSSSNQM